MILLKVYKYGGNVVDVPYPWDDGSAKGWATTFLLPTLNTASVAVLVDGVEVDHVYNYSR